MGAVARAPKLRENTTTRTTKKMNTATGMKNLTRALPKRVLAASVRRANRVVVRASEEPPTTEASNSAATPPPPPIHPVRLRHVRRGLPHPYLQGSQEGEVRHL